MKKACFQSILSFILVYIINTIGIDAVRAQGKKFTINNFSRQEYGAQNQNWDVSSGNDNFIYFANNKGLLVYDGVSWDFYSHPEIINIRAVKADPESRRVYTTGYREIGYWEWDSGGKLKYHSLNEIAGDQFRLNEEFWKIIIHGKKVIFQSFSGLFVFENNSFEVIRPNGFINTISIIEDEIYCTMLEQGIFRVREGSFHPLPVNHNLGDKLIRFLLPAGKDSILIGTASHGLFIYHRGRLRPFFPARTGYLKSKNINRGILYNDSLILVGTIMDGILGIDFRGRTRFRINEEYGLINNTVLGMTETQDKLWLALDRGIAFVDFSCDPSFDIHSLQEIGAVYSAAILNDSLYLGTNQGLYVKQLQEKDDNFRLVPGTQGQVWDCTRIDDQLFVSHNSGAFIVDEKGIRRISTVSGGFDITLNPSDKNMIFQSTYSNMVCFRKIEGEWKFSHILGNFYDLIRFVEMDHLNHLWAGHMRRSVYKLKLNDDCDSVAGLDYFGKDSPLGKDEGNHVFKLENRIAFTTGNKIFTYDDLRDSIIPFNQVNASIGKFASAHRIINAGDHHYWFISDESSGLFHFGLDSIRLVKEFPMKIFSHAVVEEYENIVPVDKHKAIFCLENGYAFLDAGAEDLRSEIKNTRLLLRNLSVADRNFNEKYLPLDEPFRIPYSKNNIKIKYSYPWYSSRKTTFRYKLEGLSDSWSEPHEKPHFVINRLPAGEYLFQVKAENEWGEVSKVNQTRLTVLPPWYRSSWALIFYGLLALAIIFMVRYFSVKKIKERERKKRRIKEQELIQLRNQNLRAELVYKSRELANSTMGIIKKNEFLMDMKETLREHKYILGTRFPDKFYNHLVTKINRNISAGDDWKIFETNVEQAHEDFLRKMIHEYPELTHSDLKLCTYLRMNLSSKEIAPLMRISVRGVENHRYRLRKKLKLSSDDKLAEFILGVEV